MRYGAIFLPGIITPAHIAYAALLERLRPRARVLAHELAIYDGPEPSDTYGLAEEIASIERAASEAGFDRFHLAGYSGGGAISAAFAARHPDRLVSLVLMEAAWLGNTGMSAAEQNARDQIEAAASLPPAQALADFARLQLAPGIQPPPPPPGDPPAWMATRPAAIATINRVFRTEDISADALRAFDKPTLYVLGGKSSPDFHGELAKRAGELFPNFRLEVFPERHHFDPPHRAEPDRVATLLLDFWNKAEARDSQ